MFPGFAVWIQRRFGAGTNNLQRRLAAPDGLVADSGSWGSLKLDFTDSWSSCSPGLQRVQGFLESWTSEIPARTSVQAVLLLNVRIGRIGRNAGDTPLGLAAQMGIPTVNTTVNTRLTYG